MPEYTNDTLQNDTLLDLTALPFWQWDTMEVPTAEVDLGIPFDSIHRPREVMDTVFRKSMFQRHSLQVQHPTFIARPDNSEPVWIFGVLLLLTGLICTYHHIRKIEFLSMIKALSDHRALERLVRDCNLTRTTMMLPMGLMLVAAICLPIHRLAMPQTEWWGYLLLAAGVGLLYILRNSIFRMLGNTFENRQGVNLYIVNNYLFHLLEATVITVLLFPFYYLPGGKTTTLYIMCGFIAIAFLLRFARGVKVFLTLPNGSSFYLFYYLCILEIVPILVLIKWITYNGSVI